MIGLRQGGKEVLAGGWGQDRTMVEKRRDQVVYLFTGEAS